MDNKDKLINIYGVYANVEKKTINELVDFLKIKGDIVEMPLEKVETSILGHFLYNIKCSEKEKGLNFQEEKLNILEYLKNPKYFFENTEYSFMVYKFLKSRDNLEFYNNYKILYEHDDTIYVIFEMKTESIYCNCTKLQIELSVYRGIDRFDVENKTNDYLHHLFCLEALDKGWY